MLDNKKAPIRILAVSAAYGLFQPLSGGRSRFYNLIKQLVLRGQDVMVVQPLMYKDKEDSSLTQTQYFRNGIMGKTFCILTDLNPSFIFKMFSILNVNRPNIIQISSPFGLITTRLMAKLLSLDSLLVYDAHNVEGDAVQSVTYVVSGSKARLMERILTSLYVFLVPFQERIAVKCVDQILTVSHEDKSLFAQKYGVSGDKLMIIPSGVNIANAKVEKGTAAESNFDSKSKYIVLFHGSYFHPPNREAIDLIIDYIAPKFTDNPIGVQFIIGGTGVPVFERNNIKSVGFVEDIYSLIRTADIAIVPIRHGGGTRLKILDYMAMGVPIVTTKKGIEGIKAENMKHAVITDDVDDMFIQAIYYLLQNKEARVQTGACARALAEAEYDWDKIGQKLYAFYETILKTKFDAHLLKD